MKKPTNLDRIQNIVKNLSRLERRQKHFMKEALVSGELQGNMYKYIITIKKHPGTSQDFLADFHSVDKSRVARVVRELEKMGYLSRSANEADRRSYRLFLTADGERIYDKIQQALMEWGTKIAKNIPAMNISVTADTMEKMIVNAD